jgi:hypothetical protein
MAWDSGVAVAPVSFSSQQQHVDERHTLRAGVHQFQFRSRRARPVPGRCATERVCGPRRSLAASRAKVCEPAALACLRAAASTVSARQRQECDAAGHSRLLMPVHRTLALHHLSITTHFGIALCLRHAINLGTAARTENSYLYHQLHGLCRESCVYSTVTISIV